MGWGVGERKQAGMTPESLVWVTEPIGVSLTINGKQEEMGFFVCGRGRVGTDAHLAIAIPITVSDALQVFKIY